MNLLRTIISTYFTGMLHLAGSTEASAHVCPSLQLILLHLRTGRRKPRLARPLVPLKQVSGHGVSGQGPLALDADAVQDEDDWKHRRVITGLV